MSVVTIVKVTKLSPVQLLAGLWQHSEDLKSLSAWLQWVSIALVFVSGALQVARFIVDRRDKQLQTERQSAAEQEQRDREQILSSTVQSLKGDLAVRQAEINELSKRTVHLDPLKQPIRAGTATVEVIIASAENVNSQFMDRGGYIAFGKGSEALTVMGSTQCNGRQLGNNQVRYRAVFNLDAEDAAIGKPTSYLNETQYIQVFFHPIPEGSLVISGKAICTINNTTRFEINIPPQKMTKEKILAPLNGQLIPEPSAGK